MFKQHFPEFLYFFNFSPGLSLLLFFSSSLLLFFSSSLFLFFSSSFLLLFSCSLLLFFSSSLLLFFSSSLHLFFSSSWLFSSSLLLGCSRLLFVIVRSQPSEFTQCTSHPRPTTGVLLPRTARGGSIGGAQVLLFAMFVRSVVARK